jgi:IS5 family transposase
MGQLFLYGTDIQLDRLAKLGDPLIKINEIIDWEIFRPPLETELRKPDYSKGGRPPTDVILMFKIVMLMSWYNLSYRQAEYQINNRLDFMRFLGVEVGMKLPDENTIWDFKEAMKTTGVYDRLFALFNLHLIDTGYKLESGSMVDASFVEVPKRRVISQKELNEPGKLLDNNSINVSLEPTEEAIIVHAEDEKTEHVLSQTDFDAHWTKKNGQ